MKSDVILVKNSGEGIESALQAAYASASYRELDRKEALQVRLLAEEMLGMMRQITGETEGSFWVESEGKNFELHLQAHPIVTGGMRRKLLSVSTSGKNAAAVGVMGKLRDIFESAFEMPDLGDGNDMAMCYSRGLVYYDGFDPMTAMPITMHTAEACSWSMQKYKSSLEQEMTGDEEAKAEWDELEKSIVANIADEIKIAITGNGVEMTVFKKFND